MEAELANLSVSALSNQSARSVLLTLSARKGHAPPASARMAALILSAAVASRKNAPVAFSPPSVLPPTAITADAYFPTARAPRINASRKLSVLHALPTRSVSRESATVANARTDLSNLCSVASLQGSAESARFQRTVQPNCAITDAVCSTQVPRARNVFALNAAPVVRTGNVFLLPVRMASASTVVLPILRNASRLPHQRRVNVNNAPRKPIVSLEFAPGGSASTERKRPWINASHEKFVLTAPQTSSAPQRSA